jgi:hypothetical protein
MTLESVTITRRVVARFNRTATVVLRGLPTGTTIDWGWYANGPPRMHVEAMSTTASRRWRVWLEDADHRRTVEPDGDTPDDVVHALAQVIEDEPGISECFLLRRDGDRTWCPLCRRSAPVAASGRLRLLQRTNSRSMPWAARRPSSPSRSRPRNVDRAGACRPPPAVRWALGAILSLR